MAANHTEGLLLELDDLLACAGKLKPCPILTLRLSKFLEHNDHNVQVGASDVLAILCWNFTGLRFDACLKRKLSEK
jgi:hypothetical protein